MNMNARQLYHDVARITGEEVGTIRRRGFNMVDLALEKANQADSLDHLCMVCPGCGAQTAISTVNGTLADWAECTACDIAYPFDDHEVFLSGHNLRYLRIADRPVAHGNYLA
jgi:hypothetical protein